MHSRTNEAFTKHRDNMSHLYILCSTKARMKRSAANLPETTDAMPFTDDGCQKPPRKRRGRES